MRTVKWNPFLSGVCAMLGGAFLGAGAAHAEVASDRAAAIVVAPKLVFTTDGDYSPNFIPTDTEIQLTNVSDQEARLQCFYVNANSHCTNDPEEVCFANEDCQAAGAGGICYAGWVETDFVIKLSPRQPLVWRISEGLAELPLADTGENIGAIPPVSEDPFFGELKCIQVDANDLPVNRNDIKAEVTIVAATAGAIDARAYNAVGIKSINGSADATLLLGPPSDTQEYDGCPAVLILDHFFDDGVDPVNGYSIKTHLTLVPCSENFVLQDAALFDTTVQYLVFNEFEQRFSTSRSLRCFHEYELCSLDQRWDRPVGNTDPAFKSCQRSIFSAYVSGTLSGQTRVRGVDDGSDAHGNGLVGVAEEFYRTDPGDLSTVVTSDAFNLDVVGERSTSDIVVYLPYPHQQ